MKTFLAPQWLWLFLAVAGFAAVYVLLQLRRKRYAARFTNVALLSSIAPRRPGWRRHVAFALLVLSLATLTVAMARPTKQVKVARDRATVMLVIDVSLSMGADDVTPTRIKAAQKAATEFVSLLPQRINVGLASFSGTVAVAVSPTTDRNKVQAAIRDLTLGPSTATGDAIAAAVGAVQNFQKQLPAGGTPQTAPARIIMLSDGARTVGRSVVEGIQAAKTAKIPVSTIAFGTPEGAIELEGVRQPVPVDTDTMRAIASQTGGSFHAAASGGELRSIYANLGSQIGYTSARREVTAWLTGIGALLAFVAAGLSLMWVGRLL